MGLFFSKRDFVDDFVDVAAKQLKREEINDTELAGGKTTIPYIMQTKMRNYIRDEYKNSNCDSMKSKVLYSQENGVLYIRIEFVCGRKMVSYMNLHPCSGCEKCNHKPSVFHVKTR